jgi:hypothetical protein
MKHQPMHTGWKRWLRIAKLNLDAFFLGAAMSWVMAPPTIQQRKELEHIFALEVGSRLMGLPLLPGMYSLRLLPYLVSSLLYWKRMTGFDRALEGADLKHLGH